MRAERFTVRACNGLDFAFFFFNRYARPVSDIFLSAGHRIKERRFSAVRVASKRKANRLAIVKYFPGTERTVLQITAGTVL